MRTDAPIHPTTAPPTGDPFTRAPRRLIAWVLVSALMIGLAAGAGVATVWFRNEADDRDAAATATATELTDRIDTLETQVADLRSEAGALRDDLRVAEGRLEQMVGPPLPEGRRFAYIEAIGATQQPPRLIVDVARWYTDEAADAAAIEDGQMPPGMDHVENGYYIRNGSPGWRVVEVSPTTMVALVVYPYGEIDDPGVVTLERFADLVDEEPWLEGLPYWLEVEDGIVTGIEQQFIP